MVETKLAPFAATFVDKMEKKLHSFLFAKKVWKIIILITEFTHCLLIQYFPPHTPVMAYVLFNKTHFLFINVFIILCFLILPL